MIGRKCTVVILPNVAEWFAFEPGNISVVRIGEKLGK